jgi:hypothetical protein
LLLKRTAQSQVAPPPLPLQVAPTAASGCHDWQQPGLRSGWVAGQTLPWPMTEDDFLRALSLEDRLRIAAVDLAVTGAPREMVAAVWEAARKIGPMRSLQGRCTRRCASYTARVARLHSEQPLSHTRDRCVPSIQKSRRFAWWCIEPGASDRAGGKHRGFARMGPIVTALPPYRSRIAPGAPDPDCAP